MVSAATSLPHIRRLNLRALPLFLTVVLLAAPLLAAVLSGVFAGGGDTWNHILSTGLFQYSATTLATLTLTGLGILLIAVPAAWLVTVYQFPGRGLFEWLLILPLAAPGYVLAFSYADVLGISGPVQSSLRDLTGWGARDYWFPDINSIGGLSFVLIAALYPYVYLTARAAFTTTSLCTLDAARTLGAGPFALFSRVAVPAARPAIVAGLALALMEAAADYGAADFLGVQTLTVGLFRAWSSHGDAGAAARMAVVLLCLALLLQWLEKVQRGEAGSQATSKRWQTLQRTVLPRSQALLAIGFCTVVFSLGLVVPMARLAWLAWETGDQGTRVLGPLGNSLMLAAAGAALSFVLGLIIALSARKPGRLSRLAQLAAAGGYAVPGAVLALGGLIVWTGLGFGFAGPLAIMTLIWVYASRFTAAGAQPMEAALARAPHSMGDAARALGAPPFLRLIRVELPVALSGALVGGLILFVEILKELPATLMLRPMNWDTLAVRAYAYASDERLAAAALPCLLITGAGLVPVLLLSWRLSKARPGAPQ